MRRERVEFGPSPLDGHELARPIDAGDYELGSDPAVTAPDQTAALDPETNRRPIIMLAGVVVLALGCLTVQLISLQVFGGARNLALAEGNRIRQKIIRAPRGVMYDRKHKLLVRNVASFDITVMPQLLPRTAPERQAVYNRLGTILGLPPPELARKSEAKGLQTTTPVLVASNIDRDKALLLDQSAANYPGFSLDVNPVRQYLDNGQLSHVIGYTGRVNDNDLKTDASYSLTDYIGKLGLERKYESALRGAGGSEQAEVDSMGRPIKLLASKQARPGANLVLTVDQDLEAKMTEAISKQLTAAGATQGTGVALDPKTGAVLASVSLPGYDNNLFAHGIASGEYTKLVKNPAQPLFNKAIDGAFPSGSIIKPLVASAALQEHIVTPETTIEDKGKLDVVNQYTGAIDRTFFGWEHSGLGVMNVYRAIAMSSDIYFYTVAGGFGKFVGLGINRLSGYYQKFGLGQPTGIDLPHEARGRIPTPAWKEQVARQPWFTGDTYNVSVGQGDLLVSPLQMASSIAAIANGGTLFAPQLVSQVLDDSGKVIKQVKPEVVRQNFIDAGHLAVVREGMRQTVVSGTACCLFDQQVPVPVAGKTGTAETDPTGGRKPHAWFEAFAPYNDPQIVMVVLIENSGEGAEYAAPAVREVLTWYFSPR